MQYNSHYFDIYSYDLVSGTQTRITNGGGNHKDPHVSGTQVVWHDYRNGERDIYLYDVGSGTEKNLTPETGNTTIKGFKDGKVLYADENAKELVLYSSAVDQKQRLGPVPSKQLIVFDGENITTVSNKEITRNTVSSLISNNGTPAGNSNISEIQETEEATSIDGIFSFKLPDHLKGKITIVKEEPQDMKGLIPYGGVYTVSLENSQTTNISILFRMEKDLDPRFAVYGFDGQAWVYLGGGMFGKERIVNADYSKYRKFALAQPNEQFIDIESHWAKDMIQILSAHQKINGYGEGRFEPDQSVSRAEFITLVANILEMPQNGSSGETFNDVLEGHWAYKTITNAYASGMVQGDGGQFYPDNKITREELVAILARAIRIKNDSYSIKEDESIARFEDHNALEQWSKPAFSFFIKNGLIKGKEENRLAPKANATRAEAAVLIYRVMNVLRGKSQ